QPRTDAEVETLLAARSRVRAHDRGAYLAMQWVHWKRLVGLTGRSISRVYAKDGETREHRLVLAHTARPSPVQKLLVRFARAVARTFAFAPILYFVIALVLVPFARRDRVALMLLASGIVLQLALAFVTWHEEYRFSTWPILATLVALVLVVSGRRAASASPG
ncbi:MAG TPA: hypothetical protein VK427_24920, partial [Kofleriaceae bacterium]|nr:hypothetical protein [Kofleriaceae bacterium]